METESSHYVGGTSNFITLFQCTYIISYLSALKETLYVNKNGGGRHWLDQSKHTPLYQNDTKEIKKRPMETTDFIKQMIPRRMKNNSLGSPDVSKYVH